jgi:hypothetical protein
MYDPYETSADYPRGREDPENFDEAMHAADRADWARFAAVVSLREPDVTYPRGGERSDDLRILPSEMPAVRAALAAVGLALVEEPKFYRIVEIEEAGS